jgi:hypothetical protein
MTAWTTRPVGPGEHPAVTGYLGLLAEQLPGDLVDELSDGLLQTYQRHARVGDPDTAATAAIAEFGDVSTVLNACVQACPGRQAARRLLLTGPLVGAAWACALVVTTAWTWQLPPLVPVLLAFTLFTTIAALVVGSAGRVSYRRTSTLGSIAAIAVLLIDTSLPVAALVAAPAVNAAVLLAIGASLTRLVWTLGRLPVLFRDGFALRVDQAR